MFEITHYLDDFGKEGLNDAIKILELIKENKLPKNYNIDELVIRYNIGTKLVYLINRNNIKLMLDKTDDKNLKLRCYNLTEDELLTIFRDRTAYNDIIFSNEINFLREEAIHNDLKELDVILKNILDFLTKNKSNFLYKQVDKMKYFHRVELGGKDYYVSKL